MSLGQPGASALFPGGQARQEWSPYWGVYASAATLPNAAGNALTGGQFKLEAGDQAYVTGTGFFTCTSPGTAGGSDAVWVSPAGDVVGPALSTNKAIARWDGATGKLLQNSVPLVTDLGEIQAAAGSAAVPAFSAGDPTLGWYRPGVNQLALSIAGVQRFTWTTTGVLASQTSGWTNAVANSTAYMAGFITTSSTPSVILYNLTSANAIQPFTGGAGTTQAAVQIPATVNQSATAAFTALDIATTETAVGSGAQYLINAKAGAAGATQIFAVTNAGRVTTAEQASGTSAYGIVGVASVGVNMTSGGVLEFISGGAARWKVVSGNLVASGVDACVIGGIVDTPLLFVGRTSTTSAPSTGFRNGPAFNATTDFTGSAAAQVGTNWSYTINQTATAGFTALDLTITETALGSGAQYLINAKTGAAGTAQRFSVTNSGGIGIAAVSPSALVSGKTNNYTGIGAYGIARLTSNAAGSELTGIAAPLDARMLTIIHVAGSTLTINNLDGGSTAANQIMTSTGAPVVMTVGDTATFWYDPTTAVWRQITAVA